MTFELDLKFHCSVLIDVRSIRRSSYGTFFEPGTRFVVVTRTEGGDARFKYFFRLSNLFRTIVHVDAIARVDKDSTSYRQSRFRSGKDVKL